ncbi:MULTISPECIES: hypothetical protein [Frankia]|uniref:Uncharacterized protein n=1 Tax=Frankia alni (strain DSM 45986 / CECT 9034 / ACN14a) TaxID=326424 RepID=Q0RM47_FRAAA|nr:MULTISPECIES: hypothetical protein [Frankia]CAJ61405.1 hypothetical protein FRAAL2761 [Frankia alni ACN14a]
METPETPRLPDDLIIKADKLAPFPRWEVLVAYRGRIRYLTPEQARTQARKLAMNARDPKITAAVQALRHAAAECGRLERAHRKERRAG